MSGIDKLWVDQSLTIFCENSVFPIPGSPETKIDLGLFSLFLSTKISRHCFISVTVLRAPWLTLWVLSLYRNHCLPWRNSRASSSTSWALWSGISLSWWWRVKLVKISSVFTEIPLVFSFSWRSVRFFMAFLRLSEYNFRPEKENQSK